MNTFKTLGLALCAAIFASTASAATITNGSFEDIGTGTLNGSGWNHFGSVPGWDGDPNVEIQSNSTLGSVNTPFGNRYAELDTNQDAGISQEITLGAGTYELSFWYSPRVNAEHTTTNDMLYKIFNTTTSLLSETINGAPNLAFPHGTFTEVTALFTTDGGTFTLAFQATGGSFFSGCGNCGALIDNVAISAVPLPAGLLLMLTGLGAFGVARRRTSV